MRLPSSGTGCCWYCAENIRVPISLLMRWSAAALSRWGWRRSPRRRSNLLFGPMATTSSHMATGTVKWFNETKGYGFIQPDQGGKDVFVHISAVERSGMSGLAEGMKVTYDLEADRKSGKESATNLKVA
jgi:cold shock protein